MSPSLSRPPVQRQPPYSRVETHGRRVTSWPPLGFRTKAKKEKKACRSALLLRWMCERPNGRLRSLLTSPVAEWGPHGGSQSNLAVTFPFMCLNSHHSVPQVTSKESSSNQTGGSRTCIQEEEKCTGCCCYGNTAFRCCPYLRMLKKLYEFEKYNINH